jgi:dual adaptor for phosphotyrosine/3-phosphotyrosine/3-phosphoinositide
MASNSIDIYNDIIDDKDDPIYDTASSESDEEDDENQRKFANLPEVQRQLECTIWFHPYLTRHQSESVLRTADEGVFLMRKRTHDEWGQYSLDVRSKMSVKHFPITLTEDGVILGSRLFPTVSSFMDHFRSTPVLTDESGTFVECRYPYPREVAEFEEYQEVTCHFIYGQDVPADRNDDSSRVGLSVGSKEGYMRKQGGIIKV